MVDRADVPRSSVALTVVKRGAAWAVLALVLILVWSWYGSYRASQAAWDAEQNRPKPSEAASAAAATERPVQTSAKAPTVGSQISKVMIVSDVTMRKDPSASAGAVRDLRKGEQLILVGQVGPWYKVTDASGAIGWVSASDRYTKIVGK
ncbi:MAG TPA: SH3 domain-containing protein [Coriobacteriia bacterium]|jgi:uncharacterized protein YgiM (DUF1202 family)